MLIDDAIQTLNQSIGMIYLRDLSQNLTDGLIPCILLWQIIQV